MKTRRSLAVVAALLVAPLAAGIEVSQIGPAPPAARVGNDAAGLELTLQIEPLAGERLVAGAFTVEFIPTPTPADTLFGDGFEAP